MLISEQQQLEYIEFITVQDDLEHAAEVSANYASVGVVVERGRARRLAMEIFTDNENPTS
jgi:hypothetical protein